MVTEAIAETGERCGVVVRVARQLGIGEQTLRNWVDQADVDVGGRESSRRTISPTRRPLTASSPITVSTVAADGRVQRLRAAAINCAISASEYR
jgi:transposase-like protein